jgi:hypothetical protein
MGNNKTTPTSQYELKKSWESLGVRHSAELLHNLATGQVI